MRRLRGIDVIGNLRAQIVRDTGVTWREVRIRPPYQPPCPRSQIRRSPPLYRRPRLRSCITERPLPRFGTWILTSPFDPSKLGAGTYHRGVNFN